MARVGVKITMSGNMFEAAQDEAWERFGAHLEGARGGTFLAVSATRPGEEVRRAIKATARKLGYGDGAATFAWLEVEARTDGDARAAEGAGATEGSSSSVREGGAGAEGSCASVRKAGAGAEGSSAIVRLAPEELMALVEGLDPLVLVALDGKAAGALGKAYRTSLVLERPGRLFGRPIAPFANFSGALTCDDAKQRAWHTLKTLPHYTGK